MFELPTVQITTAPPQLPTANEENHIEPQFGVALNNTNSTSESNTAEMNEYLLCSKLAAGAQMDHTTNMTIAHSQRNLNKISHLKQSHSALVKILESAPINSCKLSNNKIKHTKHTVNDNETSTTNTSSFSSTASSPSSATIAVTNSISNHHHHRKRNKHLIEMHCDDLDKSSDDEMGCNSNSSASSNASEAELICPWKKTRIAREWQQQPPHHHYAMQQHHHHDKSQELNDDDGEADDNSSQCECYNTWRRSSSDSNESIQNNDSGCDSDCPENITELCKKFDANLSEQDVIIANSLFSHQSINQFFAGT